MKKEVETNPLDEDIDILLNVNSSEFAYILKKSGIRTSVLANTEAAKAVNLTYNKLEKRKYGYWLKDVEPIYVAVLLKFIGYPLMKRLRENYIQERGKNGL